MRSRCNHKMHVTFDEKAGFTHFTCRITFVDCYRDIFMIFFLNATRTMFNLFILKLFKRSRKDIGCFKRALLYVSFYFSYLNKLLMQKSLWFLIKTRYVHNKIITENLYIIKMNISLGTLDSFGIEKALNSRDRHGLIHLY